eukprot:15869128-Heterocapsa_arctica.AAC.1
MDGDAGVVPLAMVLMNRLRGLQAAMIGWPYQYPAEPMTGCPKRCPPGPGLPKPWLAFPVPIITLDVPGYYKGSCNTRYTGHVGLPESPHVRDVVRSIQLDLAEATNCVGTADCIAGNEFGRMRLVFAYRRDKD